MFDHVIEWFFRRHQRAALAGRREEVMHCDAVMRYYYDVQEGRRTEQVYRDYLNGQVQ